MTINQLIENELEKNKTKWKDSTYYKYTNIYKQYIFPVFKNIKVEDLNDLMLSDFFNTLQVSNSTKLMIRRVLQLGLQHTCAIQYPIQKLHHEIDIFTKKEQKQLEAYLIAHLSLMNICILLCLYTGLRLGELCALKWNDIHVNQQYIHIHATIQRLPFNNQTRLQISEPKTIHSNRRVPIPQYICNLLKQYKIDNSFYLVSNKVKPMDPRSLQYHFKQILKKANIRKINFHALRHTFATRCVENKIDIKTVSEILGHSNITITINYYVKSTFEYKLEQIEKLAKSLE